MRRSCRRSRSPRRTVVRRRRRREATARRTFRSYRTRRSNPLPSCKPRSSARRRRCTCGSPRRSASSNNRSRWRTTPSDRGRRLGEAGIARPDRTGRRRGWRRNSPTGGPFHSPPPWVGTSSSRDPRRTRSWSGRTRPNSNRRSPRTSRRRSRRAWRRRRRRSSQASSSPARWCTRRRWPGKRPGTG